MAKQRKRTSNTKVIALLIANMLCVFVSSYFIWNVYLYWAVNSEVTAVESEAATGHWTAGGYVHWTDELTERGEQAKAAKQEFIESNDIGRWVYHSGYSLTGKILRVITIIGVILLDVYCIFCIIDGMRLLVKRFIRFVARKLIALKQKANKRQLRRECRPTTSVHR